jgi:hypothetical protein
MTYAKFALAFGMCLLCGLAVVGVVQSGLPGAVYAKVGENVCGYIGGRWGAASEHCVTRSCYARHDCGHRSGAYSHCGLLQPGDPESEVYFQLGEPDGVEDGRPWWRATKLSLDKVVAELEGGKLKSLNCPDLPRD